MCFTSSVVVKAAKPQINVYLQYFIPGIFQHKVSLFLCFLLALLAHKTLKIMS